MMQLIAIHQTLQGDQKIGPLDTVSKKSAVYFTR